jgi:DNA-binding transcriptional ArsR family regulator
LLLDKELCVCEIFAALDMSQPRVSRQLAMLKQAKIIKDRREGKWIYYRIESNTLPDYCAEILSLLPQWLDSDPEFNSDKLKLQNNSELKIKKSCCGSSIKRGDDNG